MWGSDTMRVLPCGLLALLPQVTLPAGAETPLSAEAFQNHVGTDTLTFRYESGLLGSADHGPDRTLLWAFVGSDCVRGRWYAAEDLLCFSFEHNDYDACWQFYLRDGRLVGTIQNSDGLYEIAEIARSTLPLSCAPAGPGV
jgi:hypothetical protein